MDSFGKKPNQNKTRPDFLSLLLRKGKNTNLFWCLFLKYRTLTDLGNEERASGVFFKRKYYQGSWVSITEIVKPILIISISRQGKREQKGLLCFLLYCIEDTAQKKKMSPTALNKRENGWVSGATAKHRSVSLFAK